jgi:hypothetical protein
MKKNNILVRRRQYTRVKTGMTIRIVELDATRPIHGGTVISDEFA